MQRSTSSVGPELTGLRLYVSQFHLLEVYAEWKEKAASRQGSMKRQSKRTIK